MAHQVTIVNSCYADCEKLAENEKLTVIHGDGTKPYVLEDAGAGHMDIAIALTPKDEDNLVICELCKKKFLIPKTLSLLSDPQKTDFFYQMGVDRVICAISAVTSIIEQQAFMEEMAKVIPLGEGRVRIIEIPITENDPAAQKQIWEINLPKEVIMKYTPDGSQIEIHTELRNKWVYVSVSDNGPGIPDDQKPRVFDMFYCGANKVVDSRRSLGLGLPLCKSIVNAHGGQISVTDNVPQGTVFTFTLPAGEVELHE